MLKKIFAPGKSETFAGKSIGTPIRVMGPDRIQRQQGWGGFQTRAIINWAFRRSDSILYFPLEDCSTTLPELIYTQTTCRHVLYMQCIVCI